MLAPNLASAWRYRHFIASSIQSEFRSRFVRSKLGGAWMVIHPLAQAAIFALILSEVMAAKLPGLAEDKFAYAAYLLSGMLAWALFSEIVGRCLTVFIDNGNLLKKLMFPRINLPLIVAGVALANNLLLLIATILVLAILGHPPGIYLLWVPALMLLTLSLGLGLGLVLGVFNVFIRDVGQIVPVALQLAFWFTPIVYTSAIIPTQLRPILKINPMTTVVQSFQDVLLFNRTPDILSLAWVSVSALLVLGAALTLFRRASSDLVDAL